MVLLIGNKLVIDLLKMNALPYEVLTANEWSAKVLFAEEELESINGVFLKSIATFNPNLFEKNSLKKDVIYEYIDLSCISSEKGLITNSKKIIGNALPARARLKVKEGDILLSTVRPNQNNIAIVTRDFKNCIVNNTFVVIRSLDIEPEELYFLLRSEKIKKYLDAKSQGSAIPTLKTKDIMNLKIPIEKYTSTKSKRAKTLFKQWMNHNQSINTLKEITEEKFIKHNIVRDSEGNKKPKLFQIIPYDSLEERLDVIYYSNKELAFEWLVPLHSMSKVIRKIKSGVAIPSREYKKKGIPYIRIKDMEEGAVSNKALTYVDESFKEVYKKNLIKNENILISRMGTIGKSVLVSQKYQNALANQHISIVSVNNKIVIPKYLMFYLNTRWAQEQFTQRSKGTAQKFINAKSIMEINVPIPSIEKQKTIIEDITNQIITMDSSVLKEEINKFIEQLFNK